MPRNEKKSTIAAVVVTYNRLELQYSYEIRNT